MPEFNNAQRAFLHQCGLTDDPTVSTCDPQNQTVTYTDGRVRQVCEVFSRVMGYHRPVNAYNAGKQQEHKDRTFFSEGRAAPQLTAAVGGCCG